MLSSSQCHHGAYLFPNEIIKDQPNLFLLFSSKERRERDRDEGGGAHVASCSDSCIYVLHGRWCGPSNHIISLFQIHSIHGDEEIGWSNDVRHVAHVTFDR
jgi:hypothetical protein